MRTPPMTRPDFWFGPCIGALRFTAADPRGVVNDCSSLGTILNTSLQCGVCFEALIMPVRLPCDGGHIFCFRCIRQWGHRNLSCPCCRGDIADWYNKQFSIAKPCDLVDPEREQKVVKEVFGGDREKYESCCPEACRGRFSWSLGRSAVRAVLHHVCFAKRSLSCRSPVLTGSVYVSVLMGLQIETKMGKGGVAQGRLRVGVWCEHAQPAKVVFKAMIGVEGQEIPPREAVPFPDSRVPRMSRMLRWAGNSAEQSLECDQSEGSVGHEASCPEERGPCRGVPQPRMRRSASAGMLGFRVPRGEPPAATWDQDDGPIRCTQAETCSRTLSGDFWENKEFKWSEWIPLEAVIRRIDCDGRLKISFEILQLKHLTAADVCVVQ
uniref:RING-type domain-containing protein n=1 Tax=Oxyrrhis marina TaxID=2969 RepID=A0A7S4GPS7_OXYMA